MKTFVSFAQSLELHKRPDAHLLLTKSCTGGMNDARNTARQAGLSPEYPFLHAHNALCGLEYGKHWAGVDYSLARKVLWLEQKSFEPSRIVDAINSRTFKTIQY